MTPRFITTAVDTARTLSRDPALLPWTRGARRRTFIHTRTSTLEVRSA